MKAFEAEYCSLYDAHIEHLANVYLQCHVRITGWYFHFSLFRVKATFVQIPKTGLWCRTPAPQETVNKCQH